MATVFMTILFLEGIVDETRLEVVLLLEVLNTTDERGKQTDDHHI